MTETIQIGAKVIATERTPEGRIVTHGVVTLLWEPIPEVEAPEMVTIEGIAETLHEIKPGTFLTAGEERERTITIPTAETPETSIEVLPIP